MMNANTHEDTQARAFLMRLLVGLAGGAAAAILYAPSSGREMRSYLVDRAREGRERAASAVERGRESLRVGVEAIDRGRDVLSSAIKEGREAYWQTRTHYAV